MGPLTGDPEIDDSNEPTSYRFAFFGLIGSFLFLVFWTSIAGMSFHISLIYFLLFFTFVIGLARLRVDAGFPIFIALPMIPNLFYIFGGSGFRAHMMEDYTLLGFLGGLNYTAICAILMSQIESFKISDETSARRRTRTTTC